ncbi:copper chaperone PCu(A)C [Glycomyces buryatensis]|uniref:Copper chaperone PCu(A)C n=1 Tax=Glycomyces buryatensis TaxID=2570927 RepID=A0A4S8QFL5_9ACTN|nr:copper chaperone PCu(A)C [Glycomyces buryatensis]THV40109.1 copper chaperone PCu(A)C [Glycomyces buryatensis]
MARGISTATFVRRASVFAIAGAAATALSACGAGQVSQTDTKQSAIAGVNVDAGDLALRDLQVEFESVEGYEAGADAPLRVWIDNEGDAEVSLVGVTTDAAEAVTLVSADAPEAEPTEETSEETSEEAEDEPPAEDETPAEDEEATSEEPTDGTEEDADGPEGTTEEAAEEPAEDAPLGETSFNIPIAPAQFVAFDVNAEGDYLLLEGLTEPLASGDTIEIEFHFEGAESVTAIIPVGQAEDAADREYIENPGAGGH